MYKRQPPTDAARSGAALACLQAAVDVHMDLASQDLPEYFEDHMAEWMGAFQKLLAFAPAGALAGDADDPPGPLEHAQAVTVECLSLYISKCARGEPRRAPTRPRRHVCLPF